MKTILNPIIRNGHEKVKCIHYYELSCGRSFVYFVCIFVYNDHIYLYRYNREKNKSTIINYGLNTTYHMQNALYMFVSFIADYSTNLKLIKRTRLYI